MSHARIHSFFIPLILPYTWSWSNILLETSTKLNYITKQNDHVLGNSTSRLVYKTIYIWTYIIYRLCARPHALTRINVHAWTWRVRTRTWSINWNERKHTSNTWRYLIDTCMYPETFITYTFYLTPQLKTCLQFSFLFNHTIIPTSIFQIL